MKRLIGALAAPALAFSLLGCGEGEPQIDGTECAELGAIINPDLPEAGFVIRLALGNVGDNSIRGDAVEVVQASDNAVCDRFLRKDDGLHIHSNYNKPGFWGTDREFTCGVEERGQRFGFSDARGMLKYLFETDPEVELSVTGYRRDTYTGTDDAGNQKYEKRDVCTTIEVPLR